MENERDDELRTRQLAEMRGRATTALVDGMLEEAELGAATRPIVEGALLRWQEQGVDIAPASNVRGVAAQLAERLRREMPKLFELDGQATAFEARREQVRAIAQRIGRPGGAREIA